MSYYWDRVRKERVDSLGITPAQVLKVSGKQKGTSVKSKDSKRKAMPTGKRISKYGRVYYEYRKNRTDLIGEDL